MYKIKNGFNLLKPFPVAAPLKSNLSNQFYEDLCQLYDLEPLVKVIPFEVQR
jgi:hypothetical protein